MSLTITSTLFGGGGILDVVHIKKEKNIISSYDDIISMENLLDAWQIFICGKISKKDVQEFSINLADNVYVLHGELKEKKYRHSSYQAFHISDPKPREIHKAVVRDRVVHHAIYKKLYPEYERFFIADSYSCRINKGVHKALERFQEFSYKVSKNNTRTCWVLKCDVRKCFASIDQNVLLCILKKKIVDIDILNLLEEIITSFSSVSGKGLPLGNLTSQLLVNIYLNELDQFVKHKLKVKYYIRYTDDFVIFHHSRDIFKKIVKEIGEFLHINLKFDLHERKVSIQTLSSGIDFLGWVNFPDHKILRTVTKKRMINNISIDEAGENMRQSYFGLLSHGNAYKLQKEILDISCVDDILQGK